MSRKILFTDNNKVKVNNFDKLYLVAKNRETENNENIILIDYYKYFMEAHRTTRQINNKIYLIINEDKYNTINNALLATILKSSDKELFLIVRMLLIVKDYSNKNDKIMVDMDNSSLLKPVSQLLQFPFKITVVKKRKIFTTIKNNYKYLLALPILLCNSFFIKKRNEKIIFFLWNDSVSYEFAKPYLDDNLMLYPFFTRGFYIKKVKYENSNYIKFNFIVFRELLSLIKRYIRNKKNIQQIKIDENIKKLFNSKLLSIELSSSIVLSLYSKFPNLKNIIGLFDANNYIDYITYNLNTIYNVKTICIPHGINFKYKVNYISYGVNQYTFWSSKHLETMKKNLVFKNQETDLTITGNIVYNKMVKSKCNNLSNFKNILVIGEYFPKDDFYTSAFNEKVSKKFFEILKEFVVKHKDVKITVRTRLNDEYSKLANKYCSKRFIISNSNENLINQVCAHDLIISVFSNVLHEALLLEKKVLQVNLLEIENYRNLAEEKLVYYANTEVKFKEYLEKWYLNELNELNYSKHLENYANNGLFEKLTLGKGLKC